MLARYCGDVADTVESPKEHVVHRTQQSSVEVFPFQGGHIGADRGADLFELLALCTAITPMKN